MSDDTTRYKVVMNHEEQYSISLRKQMEHLSA